VSIDGVGKRFRLARDRVDSLKERVVGRRRVRTTDFWALRDVGFEVRQGETFGLLGHNGSGKSTLLKCVAGIMPPTTGEIRTVGRVAALLELGAGFHPDLTGRENVYMNGSILGMSRGQVQRIFDEIVEFAELEAFIDNQVKHYSSGMYARLAFAIAVNVEPEIMLLDEVLAVGDEAFQRKCLERMREFQREGRTIVLVTHAADVVRQICDRAAVLDEGRLVACGEPHEAVLAFRGSLLARGLARPVVEDAAADLLAHAVRIEDVDIVYQGRSRTYAETGDAVRVDVRIHAEEPVGDVIVAMNIYDRKGNLMSGCNTEVLGADLGIVHGTVDISFELQRVALLDGVYEVQITAHSSVGGREYDRRAGQDFIEVLHAARTAGLVDLQPRAVVSRAPALRAVGQG
jgi:ABC-2 type transport system ATP-binding protein